jgi:DNA processing protein
MVDQRAAWVALALAPGIGPARLKTLLTSCGSPDGALSAPFAFLCQLPGFSRAAATAVRTARLESGQRVLDSLEAMGARCLLPEDPDYPTLLRVIPDPPQLLFVQGDVTCLHRPAVAVVGSRNHTAYGAEATRRIAGGAGAAGLVVVSGMARGLDAVAHEAGLDAGAGGIGVLGNGFGVIYPAANRSLYERIGREGLLLTEFPPGERPHAHSFPKRNRLISGLARVTVVVEAAAGSGALITANAALEQGRDVMSVPGPITSPNSVGTNRLIRDGAEPFLDLEDLLAHYPELIREMATASIAPGAGSPTTGRTAEESHLLHAIGGGSHLDQIAATLDQPIGPLLAQLAQLELEGLVEQLPGRMFRVAGS